MVDIIYDLRLLTDTGPNDFTIAGVPYWSDNQLQRVLDRHRKDFYRVEIESQSEYVGGGTIQYTRFDLPNIKHRTDHRRNGDIHD